MSAAPQVNTPENAIAAPQWFSLLQRHTGLLQYTMMSPLGVVTGATEDISGHSHQSKVEQDGFVHSLYVRHYEGVLSSIINEQVLIRAVLN